MIFVAMEPWQLQHFINMGFLSNTVVMATSMRSLLKITVNLIDKICHYASRVNDDKTIQCTKSMCNFMGKQQKYSIFQIKITEMNRTSNALTTFYRILTYLTF